MENQNNGGKKENFKFPLNETIRFKLSFDEPKTGISSVGEWYLYAGKIQEENKSFFASEALHQKLQSLGVKKNDEVFITKIAKEGEGGKLITDWIVKQPEQLSEQQPQQLSEQQPQQLSEQQPQQLSEQSEQLSEPSTVPASVWEEKDRRHDAHVAFSSAATIIAEMISTKILKTPNEIQTNCIILANTFYGCIRDEKIFAKLSGTLNDSDYQKSKNMQDLSYEESKKKKDIITIHTLLGKLEKYGFTDEIYKNLLQNNYGVTSSLDLSSEQKLELIKTLSDLLNTYLKEN